MTNKNNATTRVEVQDDGSIVTSTSYKEPTAAVIATAPINKIILYDFYLISRYDNAKGIRITLTDEAIKAGKVLPDVLKGSFTAPSEAMKFIDHHHGNQKRKKQTVVYDSRGSGHIDISDLDAAEYYSRYE